MDFCIYKLCILKIQQMLVNDEEVYKEFIFPDTGDVSLMRKIKTQDLDPYPSKVPGTLSRMSHF